MTGMDARVSPRTSSQKSAPPSSLTAWARPSLTSRPALRTVSVTETWQLMKGMSQTTRAEHAPRATAAQWRIMSSRVTERVSG